MRKHPQNPTPHIVKGGWQISASVKGETIYSTTLLCGVAPIHFSPDAVNTIIGIWFVFDTAESGANSSNNTKVEFRVGNSATYTTVGSLDTSGNPGAGVSVRGQVYHQPQPGDTLIVYPTSVSSGPASLEIEAGFTLLLENGSEVLLESSGVGGGGTVNFDNAGFAFGFDLIGERIT